MLTVRLKLYVVDMTPDYLEELFRSLPDYISYEYEVYENGSDFVDSLHRKLSRNELHIVLLTYQFGLGSSYVMNGLEVLEAAHTLQPTLNFVMLAQNKELEYTMKAKALGAYTVINRDQLPLQINSILMGLISEQRIPFARRHLLFAALYFVLLFLGFIAVLLLYSHLES
ncbi:MAG: response regulator transcription factor [Bacteroides sp.]